MDHSVFHPRNCTMMCFEIIFSLTLSFELFYITESNHMWFRKLRKTLKFLLHPKKVQLGYLMKFELWF